MKILNNTLKHVTTSHGYFLIALIVSAVAFATACTANQTISTHTPLPTHTPTQIPTHTPTLLPTITPTYTPTPVPTNTPIPTHTPLPTHTPTQIPTHTPTLLPTITPTYTPTPVPTNTPIPTHTPLPTHTPTQIPTHTPTLLPTITPTYTPTYTPTVTSTPTQTPIVEPKLTDAEIEILSQQVAPSLVKFYTKYDGLRDDEIAGDYGPGWIYKVDDFGTAWFITTTDIVNGISEIGTNQAKLDGRFVPVKSQIEADWRVGRIVAYDEKEELAIVTICCNRAWKPLHLAVNPPGPMLTDMTLFGASVAFDDSHLKKRVPMTYRPNWFGADSYQWFLGERANPNGRIYRGGPIVDRSGEVVGVFMDKAPRTGLRRHVSDIKIIAGLINDYEDTATNLAIVKPPQHIPLPSNYVLRFGESVGDWYKFLIEHGIRVIHDFGAEFGVPPLTEEFRFYVGSGPDLGRFFLDEGYSIEDPNNYSCFASGWINDKGAVVCLPQGHIYHLTSKLHTTMHEFVHLVFQKGIAGLKTDRGWFVERRARYSKEWFSEGMAEFLSEIAIARYEGRDYQIAPWLRKEVLESSPDLDQLETRVHKRDIYTTGEVASAFLASQVGIQALFDFHMNSKPYSTFQCQFQSSFGFSLTRFYEMFEEHRAAGLPDLEIPDSVEIQRLPEPDIVPTEREALVALYNATGGANWRNNINWLTDAPADEWHGVGTDCQGHVTYIELVANGLSGHLPKELETLPHLEDLRLASNNLIGEIPEELGNLQKLEILILNNNNLTGEIPDTFNELVRLHSLVLRNNQLSGVIPAGIANLPNINSVAVSANQFTGCIAPDLLNIPINDLDYVDLATCK